MQGSRGGAHDDAAVSIVSCIPIMPRKSWQEVCIGACLTTGGRQPRNTGRGGIVAARHSHFLRVGHKLWIRGARLLFARCGCRWCRRRRWWCRRRRWWCRRRRWPSCIPARGCPELAQASVGKVLRRATKSVRAISTTSWLRARRAGGTGLDRSAACARRDRGSPRTRHPAFLPLESSMIRDQPQPE